MNTTRVILFQIKTAQEKLLKLFDTVRGHFEKRERIVIFAEDEKAAQFVDEWLWKMSFLPHVLTEETTQDFVAISKSKKNVNEARVAFNLCPTPLLFDFKMIYDFDDFTTPSKKQFSELRFDAYKKAGYLIEARNLSQ